MQNFKISFAYCSHDCHDLRMNPKLPFCEENAYNKRINHVSTKEKLMIHVLADNSRYLDLDNTFVPNDCTRYMTRI